MYYLLNNCLHEGATQDLKKLKESLLATEGTLISKYYGMDGYIRMIKRECREKGISRELMFLTGMQGAILSRIVMVSLNKSPKERYAEFLDECMKWV